jgi:hypothetical protein
MLRGYALIKTTAGKENKVANYVAHVHYVKSSSTLSGEYGVLAFFVAPDIDTFKKILLYNIGRSEHVRIITPLIELKRIEPEKDLIPKPLV